MKPEAEIQLCTNCVAHLLTLPIITSQIPHYWVADLLPPLSNEAATLQAVAAVYHSLHQGTRFICPQHSAISSALALSCTMHLSSIHCWEQSPTSTVASQCHGKTRTEACLDINTKVKFYRSFQLPAGSSFLQLSHELSSTDFRALLKEISVCIYKQRNCVQEKLIAEPEIVPQLSSPTPAPNVLSYTCPSESCCGQLPLAAALVFLNVPSAFLIWCL